MSEYNDNTNEPAGMVNDDGGIYHPQQPLTFDKVWLMFHETDKKFQETERLMKEQSKETDKKIQETDRELEKLKVI